MFEKILRYGYLGVTTLTFILGGVLAVWAAFPVTALAVIYGIVLFFSAVVRLLNGVRPKLQHMTERFDIALGAFHLFLAYLLIAHTPVMASIFPVLLGFNLLIGGILKMQAGFDTKAQGAKLAGWLPSVALAILVLVYGVVIIVVQASFRANLLMGVGLMLEGLIHFIDLFWAQKFPPMGKEEVAA